jgi:hypothetical protein
MDPFEIFSGENLLIEVPIYILASGYIWRGRYDNAALYVTDDALLGDDNIGYHVTADVGPGVPPPNATYYEALDPVPVTSITSILVQLVQAGQNKVSWLYRGRIARLTAGPLTVGRQYLIYTFGAGDVFTNVGAGSNAAGVIFTATGTTPTTWTHGSVLYQIDFPSNFALQEGLFQAELLASDTTQLTGLFELRIAMSAEDAIYIASGAQTDVLCIPDAIRVTPC